MSGDWTDGSTEHQISELERRQLLEVAQSVMALTEHEGWDALCKQIERVISAETPRPMQLNNQDHLLQVATKSAHLAGLKRVFSIVKQNFDTYANFSKPVLSAEEEHEDQD